MKSLFVFAGALLIAFMFASKNTAQPVPAQQRTPVLVELFTSEGCSSCPPADKLLSELKEKQPIPNAQVIALGLHVDYWNNIGWVDRFSSPAFTARQEQYANWLNDGPYTPQMLVDGTASVVGNDENGVDRAIAKASAAGKPVQIELSEGDGQVHVSLRGVANSSPELFFVLVEDDVESRVKGGENNGVTLHHVAVARELRSLGHASSDSWKASIPVRLASGQRKEKTQVLVFAQNYGGRVVGVNTIPLH